MLKKSNQKLWSQISALSILSLAFVLSNSIAAFSTLRGTVIVDEKNFWGHNGKFSNSNSKATYIVCDGYIGSPLIPNSREAIQAFANNCEVTPPPGALPIIDVPENHSPNYVGYPAYPVQVEGYERLYFVCDGYLNSTSWCSFESHKSATKLARASASRYWEQGLNSIRGNNIGGPNFGSPQTFGRIVGNYNSASSINSTMSSNSSVSFPQGFPQSTSLANSHYDNPNGGFDINVLIRSLQNGNGSIPNLVNAQKVRATQIDRSGLPQGQIIPLQAIPLNPKPIGGVSSNSQLINFNGDSQRTDQTQEIVSRIKNANDYNSNSLIDGNYPYPLNENNSSKPKAAEKAKADLVKQELKKFITNTVQEAVNDAVNNALSDQEYSDNVSDTNYGFANNRSVTKTKYTTQSRSNFTDSTQSKSSSKPQSRSSDGIRRKQIVDIEEDYQEEITYTPISKSTQSTNQANTRLAPQASNSSNLEDESEEDYDDDGEEISSSSTNRNSINNSTTQFASQSSDQIKAPKPSYSEIEESEDEEYDEEEGD